MSAPQRYISFTTQGVTRVPTARKSLHSQHNNMDSLTWIYGLKFISLWSMTLWMHGAMCFNAGAPASTCLGHHTSHNGIMPQTVPVPFQVKLSSETYLPSQNISVTLASTNNGTFKGFLIVAHRTVGDKEKAIGTIIEYPTQKTKVQRCVYDEKTVLTHINNDTVHEIQFIWNAPDTDQGDLHFKYMVAVDFETFWFDQTSPILKSATQRQYIPPHVEQESFDIPDINWSSCGITKGCFLYPKTCTGNDCTAAVTYRPEGGNFVFEMFVSGQEQVAVGFSNDKKMGADHVHACTGAYGKLSVQEGYNPFTYYMRNYRSELSNMAVKYSNGNIQCHLTRPRSMLVYSEHEGNITFDLNNRYYLFLAWGAVYTNTDVLVHHYELPAVTESTVNFYDNQIVRGTTLHVLVQVHGILMFVAWILFVGITTIVSRYYKEGFGRKLMCGMKPWFQLHRSCGIVAWLLTAAAFVVIFIKVQGLSQIAKVHSYLGIAVMSACTLQVLAGLLRPGLDSNIRSAFNFVHWLFGKTTHILSVVTFYFAFTSDVISSQQLDFGVVVLSVWVGNQVFWEIVFEVRKCTRSKGVSEKYELSNVKTSGGLEMESRDDTYQTMSRIDAVFLCMYVICILTLTAAAIASVILY